MFTGIVDHCGRISKREEQQEKMRVWIDCDFADFAEGESIAVDGVCLTVVDSTAVSFCVEISPETRRLTTANQYAKGSLVNLERALRVGDRLGGHFVTGHVDQMCCVASMKNLKEFLEVNFVDVREENKSYLIPKGSIAINGVSLTINQIEENGFQVMLIPHTLKKTNLESLHIGQQVNVECDYLAKCVLNQVRNGGMK